MELTEKQQAERERRRQRKQSVLYGWDDETVRSEPTKSRPEKLTRSKKPDASLRI